MNKQKCAVCDSPNVANFHFGARTCKACAAFFRRSVSMKQNYECQSKLNKLSCRINYNLRLNCRQCRLNKCFLAGMMKDLVQSKKEIKTTINEQLPDISYKKKTGEIINHQIFPQSEDEFQIYSKEFEEYLRINNPSQMKINENWNEVPSTSTFLNYSENDSYLINNQLKINQYNNHENEEKYYNLAEIYVNQCIDLNIRRKMTYTDQSISSLFDGPCLCPYEKIDLKLFDHKTYRQKKRNDYSMILDYVNKFPDFNFLTKSEKTVLFRTAVAVDILTDQVFYSSILFDEESILVTPNGEYFLMDNLRIPESDEFESDGDYNKNKFLTKMKQRQWEYVIVPIKKLKMSFTEYSLFKALIIWHYNYFKMQENGKLISLKQRENIIKSLLIICQDEGFENPHIRLGEIILAMSHVMEEIHEMVTSYIEITVFDVLDDPILKDMLTFQY